MRLTYDELAYEQRGAVVPSFIPYLKDLVGRTRSIFGRSPRVLDVGAGAGGYAAELQRLGCNVTAQDSSPAGLSLAKGKVSRLVREDFGQLAPPPKYAGALAKDVVSDYEIPAVEFFKTASSIMELKGIIMVCLLDDLVNHGISLNTERYGFAEISRTYWTPSEEERDWYPIFQDKKREILIYQKFR